MPLVSLLCLAERWPLARVSSRVTVISNTKARLGVRIFRSGTQGEFCVLSADRQPIFGSGLHPMCPALLVVPTNRREDSSSKAKRTIDTIAHPQSLWLCPKRRHAKSITSIDRPIELSHLATRRKGRGCKTRTNVDVDGSCFESERRLSNLLYKNCCASQICCLIAGRRDLCNQLQRRFITE